MSYRDGDSDLEQEYGRESPARAESESPPPLQDYADAFQALNDPKARDWNGEFQQLLAEATLFDDTPGENGKLYAGFLSRLLDKSIKNPYRSEKEFQRTLKLRQLSNSFAEEATRIAVQIVQELFFPVGNRRIKSVTHLVGGIAGGEKFVCSGIFFKLSRDWKGIYGSDGHAIKAAELELKGTMALLDCRVSGLHFPLMALIRYRGFAVVAQSILPIKQTTLKYGSGDAGRSIKNEDALLASKFAAAARVLNLKSHQVWNKDRTQSALLHGPADIEGHLGTDGLYYVVDTARLFPPTAPRNKTRTQLYCALRPEFVKLNPCSLSSDAFSAFGGPDNSLHDLEVVVATDRLLKSVIPSFAKYLDKRYKEEYTISDKFSESFDDISAIIELNSLGAEMHLHGINCRYLLYVWTYLGEATVRTLALLEACARTAKHLLEEKWRCLEAASEIQYLREASEFMCVLSGCSEESHAYWTETMADEVLSRFRIPEGAVSPFPDNFDFRSLVPVPLLLFRTSQLVGVEFNFELLHNLSVESGLVTPPITPASTDEAVYQVLKSLLSTAASYLFRKTLFSSIIPRTKYLHRVSFEEGTALCRVALTRTGAEARRLFRQANDRFAECLATKPNDYRALYNWAFALSQQACNADPDEASLLWKEMADKFTRALILQPKDWRALWKWGTALQMRSRSLDGPSAIDALQESSSKLNQAVSLLSFPHFKTLFNAGNADLSLARAIDHSSAVDSSRVEKTLSRSLQHLTKAILLEPHNVDALRNGAVATAMLARLTTDFARKEVLYDRSFSLYQRALALSPRNSEVLYSCGNAYFRRAMSQHERGDENAGPNLFKSSQMYASALECTQSFKDSFVNLAVTIALAVKWNVTLFAAIENSWLSPVQSFVKFAQAFDGQPTRTNQFTVSARELSSIAAACKGLTSRQSPTDVSAAAATILERLLSMMKESPQSATTPPSRSRKRSTSVGQNTAETPSKSGPSAPRTLVSSGVMGAKISNSGTRPRKVDNDRHGETDEVSALSILSTPRESPSAHLVRRDYEPSLRVASVEVDWGAANPYSFDHDTDICEATLKLLNTILGRSRTGLIFSADYKGTQYALKVRPKRSPSELPKRIAVLQGAAYAQLKYVFQSDGKVCCLFERARGIPLETYIVQRPQRFSPSSLRFYFAEICAACAPIVEAGFQLVDFKSSSILISDSGHTCVLFSFLDVVEGGDPESVWLSVGVFFSDLLSKATSFEHSVTQEMASLISLAQQMTDQNPLKRLKSFRKIKRHSVFEGVKWRRLWSEVPPFEYDGPGGGVDIPEHGIAATLVAPEVPNQLDGFTVVNTPVSHRP